MIELEEPTTGVPVYLIGCMHYNPASIALTRQTIQDLADRDQLGAVVIESCDIRWDKNNDLPESIQKLLTSEMKAAVDVATSEPYQRPVVLGDQRINVTVASLGRGLKETLVDLATPFSGCTQINGFGCADGDQVVTGVIEKCGLGEFAGAQIVFVFLGSDKDKAILLVAGEEVGVLIQGFIDPGQRSLGPEVVPVVVEPILGQFPILRDVGKELVFLDRLCGKRV